FEGQSLQPYPIEQALDQDIDIQRAAFINHAGGVCLFVQLKHSASTVQDKSTVQNELKKRISDISAEYFLPLGLKEIQYYQIANMPVDGRHNSKIDRPLLRESLTKNKINNSQWLAL
ncbi:MAG: hypothetical protein ACI910_001788, partial [Oleispira sp.]